MSATPVIIIDTNVVLDALVFNDPGVASLFSQIREGRWRWLVSAPMQVELRRVLDYETIARRNVDADELLLQAATLWQALPAHRPDRALLPGPVRCRDPDDQMFIDLAIEHRAAYLLSRDKALLSLAKPALRHGVTVLTPQRWLLRQTGLISAGPSA